MTPPDTIASLRDELDEARETIRQLREQLTGSPLIGYAGVRLSRSEKAVMERLYRADGAVVGQSDLRDVIDHRLSVTDTFSASSVSVVVCRLRAKLRSLSPPIRIENSWGEGFYLDRANRDLVDEIRILPPKGYRF